MIERRLCLICYRLTSDSVDHKQPLQEDKQQALTRFFRFLGRHLDDNYKTDGQNGYGFEPMQFPVEKVIHAGLLTCADCSRIIESFCELYHKMKSMELLLNWKVRTLKNIMLCAQRVPARVSEFRICVAKLHIGDISTDEIFDFKKELVKKCDGILQTSLPRLKLSKNETGNYAAKSVTETNPNLLVDDTERGQSPCSPLSEFDKEKTDEVDNLGSHLVCGLHDDNFPTKSTVNAHLLLSPEVVQVKEDRSQHTNRITLSPQTTHEPEFEISDVRPGHNLISSIRKGCYKTKNQKVFDDNLPNCTPPGRRGSISDSADKEYSVLPPPIIIPPKDANGHQKPEVKKDPRFPRKTISLPSKANNPAQIVSENFEKTVPVSTVHLPRLPKKKNMCNFCNANFVHRSTLSTHKLICPKKPATQSTTSQKQNAKGSRKHVYRCSNCSKVFTQNCHLKRHFMTVHLQLREFQCELCTGKFKRKDSLDLHRRKVHSKSKIMRQNHHEMELD